MVVRRVGAVLLLLLVAVAGCSSPPADLPPAHADGSPAQDPDGDGGREPAGKPQPSATGTPTGKPQATLRADWSPATPRTGESVRFTAKVEGLGARKVEAYGWEFGDNATASVRDPTHTYVAAAHYEVTARAMLSDGTVVRATRTVSVASAGQAAGPGNATAGQPGAAALPSSEGCTTHESANPRPSAWYSLGKPATYYDDGCFHQYMVNDPDTATLDVLIVPAAGPTALRDARLVRASAEMWEAGIQAGARTHGMPWLADGLSITPFVLGLDVPAGPSALAPDIVVVLQDAGPAGITWAYAGIGTDGPLSYCRPVQAAAEGRLASPAELASLPTQDAHHGRGWSTTVVDCPRGARTCIVAGAVLYDLPDEFQAINLYDLMSHEFGHCLGLGHVGDASDFAAQAYPPDDIMSYEQDDHEPGVALCVSNLNLKTFALRYQPLVAGAPRLPYTADADGYVTMQGGADPTSGSAVLSPLPATSWRIFRADGSESPTVKDCPQPALGLL